MTAPILAGPQPDGTHRAYPEKREAARDAKPDVWRCFHCDEEFTDAAAAREHFGATELADPICGVTAERYREVERQLASFLAETDAASTTFYRLGAEHAAKERRAEQAGYDRGLADAKAHPETLGLMPADAAARIAALEEVVVVANHALQMILASAHGFSDLSDAQLADIVNEAAEVVDKAIPMDAKP